MKATIAAITEAAATPPIALRLSFTLIGELSTLTSFVMTGSLFNGSGDFLNSDSKN
jgi:hypothetical protein